MAETLYRKVGRRYVPVSVHDAATYDALPIGTHLVHVEPYQRLTSTHVRPADAQVLACILEHREALAKAISEKSCIRPFSAKLSRTEAKAWQAYTAIAGRTMLVVSKPSANEIIDTLRDLIIARLQRVA